MAKTEFEQLMLVGIDIGKDSFHNLGFDEDGELVLQRKIIMTERGKSGGFFGRLPTWMTSAFMISGTVLPVSLYRVVQACRSWDGIC